jgi:hypothetical protein
MAGSGGSQVLSLSASRMASSAVATVHHGYCPSCNHGGGQWGRRDERASTWHGPYSSEGEARSALIRGNSMFRECGSRMR